jgi:hypothetical protein
MRLFIVIKSFLFDRYPIQILISLLLNVDDQLLEFIDIITEEDSELYRIQLHNLTLNIVCFDLGLFDS